MKGVYKLKGVVQHYTWGGHEFLPKLLGVINPQGKPFAEYWMGTHSKSPALIIRNDKETLLSDLATVPYLFKVLDVKDMLSIQVHPSKKAAEEAYQLENNDRIPLDAPNRNYKDDNHKPELAYALSEFWLLHGFKSEEKLVRILAQVPEFAGLLNVFRAEGYEGLYKKVMGMPQEDVDFILQPVLERVIPLYVQGVLDKGEEDYWAAKGALTFNQDGHADRGIFSIYFFNIVRLAPGEAVFQDAGIPHAYLFGQCVEIMANSDNVLRGGLTTKHIDVKELLKHTRCEPVIPQILHGIQKNPHEKVFKTPAPDFELSRIDLNKDEIQNDQADGDEILLVLNGQADFTSGDEVIKTAKGEAVFISSGSPFSIKSQDQTTIFRAIAPSTTRE